MDHRQKLIDEVKYNYARLADIQSRQVYSPAQFSNMTVEAYYEKLLSDVIGSIQSGAYDGFSSGQDIIESIANTR